LPNTETVSSTTPPGPMTVTVKKLPRRLDVVPSSGNHPEPPSPQCLICECPFDPTADGSESMTCPACVALRSGLVTATEAGEMRLLARLSLMGTDS
jgi:hypothetical protein